MARSSKDVAKRLRFDHRPRPDAFRRWYFVAGLLACAAGVAAWFTLTGSMGQRQYLPGPLTPAHATFGDRCEHCHVAFAATPDDKCLACHAPRRHSDLEVGAPRCWDCHVEHRSARLLLTLSDRPCVDCHGNLQGRGPLAVAAHIASFAEHPEFAPLRDGQHDAAALRFNHRLHLTSKNVNERLTCANCHVVAADGDYMQPIQFERHCQRCHALKITEGVPAPISDLAAPHEAPGTIRDALTAALLALGAQRANELFASNAEVLLPGRAARGPLDESRSLAEFQRKWLAILEAAFYKPFVDTPPLLENNKQCFLCHLQGPEPDANGLPTVVATKLPARWLARSEFSHRRHDELQCATCHPGIETSALTGDVNLPGRAVCAQCHADGRAQSAGTDCLLCHRYHDTSRDPAKRAAGARAVPIQRLLGSPE